MRSQFPGTGDFDGSADSCIAPFYGTDCPSDVINNRGFPYNLSNIEDEDDIHAAMAPTIRYLDSDGPCSDWARLPGRSIPHAGLVLCDHPCFRCIALSPARMVVWLVAKKRANLDQDHTDTIRVVCSFVALVLQSNR